jgi:hypothetical protein
MLTGKLTLGNCERSFREIINFPPSLPIHNWLLKDAGSFLLFCQSNAHQPPSPEPGLYVEEMESRCPRGCSLGLMEGMGRVGTQVSLWKILHSF